MISKSQLIQCFTFRNDDWNMVTYRDYHGQYQEQPANTWFTLFRYSMPNFHKSSRSMFSFCLPLIEKYFMLLKMVLFMVNFLLMLKIRCYVLLITIHTMKCHLFSIDWYHRCLLRTK